MSCVGEACSFVAKRAHSVTNDIAKHIMILLRHREDYHLYLIS